MRRPHLSNWPLAGIVLSLVSFLAWGATPDCREVQLVSVATSGKETTDLCFVRSDSFFISRNCLALECQFVQKLKVMGLKRSGLMRPGRATCAALGGGSDMVQIPGGKQPISRCVFKEDHSSISFNLLESWNGKAFAGPAK